jgi:hypothetical protein
MPEYLLTFRKPPTDRSNGYADEPVAKAKDEYTRGRWQVDAAGFWRSSGDRLIGLEDLAMMDSAVIYRLWRKFNLAEVYDFEHHVRLGEALEAIGRLPPDFALIPAHSFHPDVWTNVARMRTLNMVQARKGKEQHLCPFPLDIPSRCIAQRSMPGELVFDPFSGLGATVYCALQLGRRGIGTELSPDYFADSVAHCSGLTAGIDLPHFFDALEAEDAIAGLLRRSAGAYQAGWVDEAEAGTASPWLLVEPGLEAAA